MIKRVILVGLGSIGNLHLRLARDMLPNADIRILRNSPVETFPELANGSFSTLEQAIAFAPQIAVLSNPAPFHAQVGKSLALNGCHLLVEKPLAVSSSEGMALVQACISSGRILQVGYNLRYLPSMLHFKSVIDKGILGAIWSVRSEVGQYLPSWRPGTDYRQGVSAQQRLGGGVLLELSHEIDYLRWIFGNVDWVGAVLGRHSNLEIDVEDTAHLTLGFTPSNGKRTIANLNMDFLRHDTTRICSVIGAFGSLRWDAVASKVEFFGIKEQSWLTLFSESSEREVSYRAQFRAFLDCVSNARKPPPDGYDSLAVLDVIEAARRSDALKGQRIPILGRKK
jgi:predicted dehydrogenase